MQEFANAVTDDPGVSYRAISIMCVYITDEAHITNFMNTYPQYTQAALNTMDPSFFGNRNLMLNAFRILHEYSAQGVNVDASILSDELKKDRKFMLELVRIKGSHFAFARANVRADRTIYDVARATYFNAAYFTSGALREELRRRGDVVS